jgi:hypothetical protein
MLVWYLEDVKKKSHLEEKRNQNLTNSMMTTIGQKRNTKTELGNLLSNEFGDRSCHQKTGKLRKRED